MISLHVRSVRIMMPCIHKRLTLLPVTLYSVCSFSFFETHSLRFANLLRQPLCYLASAACVSLKHRESLSLTRTDSVAYLKTKCALSYIFRIPINSKNNLYFNNRDNKVTKTVWKSLQSCFQTLVHFKKCSMV